MIEISGTSAGKRPSGGSVKSPPSAREGKSQITIANNRMEESLPLILPNFEEFLRIYETTPECHSFARGISPDLYTRREVSETSAETLVSGLLSPRDD